MKKRYLFGFLIATFVIEVLIVVLTLNKTYKVDTVRINELTNEITNNFDNEDKYPKDMFYSIIDDNGKLIFDNNNPSKSLTEAYRNQDTIIDFSINGNNYKLLVRSSVQDFIDENNRTIILTVSVSSSIQILVVILYYLYLQKTIIKPFSSLRSFAERVANGNLDIPLTMDKGNNFGAFTESFDIMREELKKARIKEKEANDSKRELVAKLSHDIKTPVASIKSTSELGVVVSKDEKEKSYFSTINTKADQISTLISNLLTSSVNELTSIQINPVECSSLIIKELVKNSDYLSKVKEFDVKECLIYADRVRLQQVIDNVISNSYKYAGTDIEIKTNIDGDYFSLEIKDFGNTIDDLEIPLLFEKYKRGSNSKDKDGVGLGLFISKEFIEAMEGILEIKNDNPGFKVIIKLRII